MPHLQKIHEEYDAKGLEIIVVDVTNRLEQTKKIFDERSISLKLLLANPDESARIFNPTALPTTLIIDRAGRVVFRHIGFYMGMEEGLRKEIEALIYRAI